MKKLIAIAIAAIATLIAIPNAEARPYGQRSVFVSGHSACGCPIYSKRYIAFYDRCDRPVYRTRLLPVRHQCRHSVRASRNHYRNEYVRSHRYYNERRGLQIGPVFVQPRRDRSCR